MPAAPPASGRPHAQPEPGTAARRPHLHRELLPCRGGQAVWASWLPSLQPPAEGWAEAPPPAAAFLNLSTHPASTSQPQPQGPGREIGQLPGGWLLGAERLAGGGPGVLGLRFPPVSVPEDTQLRHSAKTKDGTEFKKDNSFAPVVILKACYVWVGRSEDGQHPGPLSVSEVTLGCPCGYQVEPLSRFFCVTRSLCHRASRYDSHGYPVAAWADFKHTASKLQCCCFLMFELPFCERKKSRSEGGAGCVTAETGTGFEPPLPQTTKQRPR
ncbi:uncharacterized protein LOC128120504 [Peromyscus californicus insignis]|uniref:uncharacterized protein LOC128120504 n=1 Tax=Peromyscus californicus insignis TaxID=564181 RepID=UPI0022A72CFA|nr:uncharacterized protein LOC128120504 [Peromyscus californicus insignis]